MAVNFVLGILSVLGASLRWVLLLSVALALVAAEGVERVLQHLHAVLAVAGLECAALQIL